MTYPLTDTVGNGQGGVGSAVDSSTGALKVSEQNQPRFDDVANPVLVDETNLAVGTYYYPDSAGVSMLGYRSLSFEGEITAVGDTWVLTLEATNGAVWVDVTGQFLDNAGVQPISGPNITVTGSTTLFGLSKEHFDFSYYRVKIVVSGTVTANSGKVASYRKAI